MWDEIFDEISQDYRDVNTDKMLVDAMTTRMVLDQKVLIPLLLQIYMLIF